MPLLAVFELGHPALAWAAAVMFATVTARFAIASTGRGWIGGAFLIAGASLGAIGGGEIGHAALFLAALMAASWLAVETYRATFAPGLPRRLGRLALTARIVMLVLVVLLAARPTGQWNVVDWRRPLLVVLLDQSSSMAIVDPDASAATQPTQSRADTANAMLRRADLGRLDRFYEVAIRAIGDDPRQLTGFEIDPADPATSIDAALRVAAQLRSHYGETPRTVLLVSDGGENLADPQRVRLAALELAAAKAGLVALGVGPARGGAVLSIDPLQIPARIGTRERLLVPVTLRSAGCRNALIDLDLAWNDATADGKTVKPASDPAVITAEFSVTPPGPGVHRLTVSATLPDDRGGGIFSRSALVEVRDDRIRVLIVDDQFRSEAAFIARALRTDPAFLVDQRILVAPDSPIGGDSNLDDADAFDVILIGDISRSRKPGDAYDRIAAAVAERGVGLLFTGGAETLSNAAGTRSMLLDLLPMRAERASPPPRRMVRMIPTERGLAHSIFSHTGDVPSALAAWRASPPVACEPLPPTLKPLVETLASDEANNPVLVGTEVGRGRILQSALRETWPWALASDAGLDLHRRTWRQIARWLANRRPQAWVLSDQPDYLLSALASGRERIRIRAGVTGLGPDDRLDGLTAQLQVAREAALTPSSTAPASSPAAIPVPLTLRDGEWHAELPGPAGIALETGRYRLEFSLGPRPGPKPAEGGSARSATLAAELRASTVFDVASIDRELEPPTHDLALLRDAAEATKTFGGRYASIDALPALVDQLLAKDVRQRVQSTVDYDFTRRQAWLLLALAAAAAAIEWSIRRAVGLR